MLLSALTCRYKALPKAASKPKYNKTIALIISCHNSSGSISATLLAALAHFPPENIIVADNGNSTAPTDNTQGIVFGVSPKIKYRYTSVGNKTAAQFLACRYLVNQRADIEQIMIIDDDVTLASNLSLPVERLNEVTKCIVYGIRGVDSQGGQDMMWTKWQVCSIVIQDAEYKLADFAKILQDKFASVLFPRGAISLWTKEILYQVLLDHDGVFFADDVKMGMWLTRRGYTMAFNAEAVVNTETPDTILGPGLNYYNQRVRSWDFAEHMTSWQHVMCVLFGYVRRNGGNGFFNVDVSKTVVKKVCQLYCVMCIISDWLRIPGIAYAIINFTPSFGVSLAIVLAVNLLIVLLWKFVPLRTRPDLSVSVATILTLPIYKLISSLLRVVALFRCYLVYWPRFQPKDCRPARLTDERTSQLEKVGAGKHTDRFGMFYFNAPMQFPTSPTSPKGETCFSISRADSQSPKTPLPAFLPFPAK